MASSSAKGFDRRKSYKAPPTAVDGGNSSQEARRLNALEEQKRKRNQRVETSRQLDLFAGLHLGLSDDEDEDDNEQRVVREGVGNFASLLSVDDPQGPPPSATPSPASTIGLLPNVENGNPTSKGKSKRRKKAKRKPSKWADKCMYAELLEMHDSPLWTPNGIQDGLPSDLESGWVAVAPVPAGKRCLAISTQNAGSSTFVPNTMLRSRLLGKVLLPPFPSPLPANTILDCILDENWKSNGVLHILDVIRWKSQDVAGCDASFRFWWRDTRLSELPPWPLPRHTRSSYARQEGDIFPYPATFTAIPYFTPTPLELFISTIVPSAHAGRAIRIKIPNPDYGQGGLTTSDEMEVDTNAHRLTSEVHAAEVETDVHLRSDGILLYVAEAAYETGTSPLSAWIPFGNQVNANDVGDGCTAVNDTLLERFDRLLRNRIESRADAQVTTTEA